MPLQLYKIASNDLTATASSVTFSSIPQGYTDLKIVGSTRDDRSAFSNSPVVMTHINGSSVTGASVKNLGGNGSSAFSESYSQLWAGQSSRTANTANTFSNWECYIPNYTSSNAKSFSSDAVTENNATEAGQSLAASLWTGTAAISSLTLTPSYATTFLTGSTFTLYGIL